MCISNIDHYCVAIVTPGYSFCEDTNNNEEDEQHEVKRTQLKPHMWIKILR
jgi:hypothetical protein